MSDINCAHCGEPWDVCGLRHEGWQYFDYDRPTSTGMQGVPKLVREALDGIYELDKCQVRDNFESHVNGWVYKAVLSGKGCHHCGFAHKGLGEHREEQLRALVMDGVTDDDPMMFM